MRDIKGKFAVKHGQAGTRIYRIWGLIKRRCYVSSCDSYKNYGKRGIEVCDEWRYSFEAFYQWALVNGYKDSLTIDRIDVNGNYEPLNCRWATSKEQNRNKTNNTYYFYKGSLKTITEIAEDCGIKNWRSLLKRLKRGWALNEALAIPFGKNKPSIKTVRGA